MLRWLPEYENDRQVIYELDENFRILRCNRAWDRFALDNNGSAATYKKAQGVMLFTVIPRDLSRFYEEGFQIAKRQSQWQHVFDCSSARVIRRLRMTVVSSGFGLVVKNMLVKDTLAPPSEADGNWADYGSRITMCCHCRRVQNKKTAVWQWVPEFIEQMPADARTLLCPSCYAYHYGGVCQSSLKAHSA